jgi:hypothetical protein
MQGIGHVFSGVLAKPGRCRRAAVSNWGPRSVFIRTASALVGIVFIIRVFIICVGCVARRCVRNLKRTQPRAAKDSDPTQASTLYKSCPKLGN